MEGSKGTVPVAPLAPSAPPSLGAPSGLSALPPPGATPPAAPSAPTPASALVGSDLPSFEPALANIQPIATKKLSMIVNTFVINTTEFLNKFAIICERKLAKVDKNVERLHIVLALLEAKLDSIKYLAGTESSSSVAPSAPVAPTVPASFVPLTPRGNVEGENKVSDVNPVASVPPAEEKQTPKIAIKDDSRYTTYFKMLRLGVPKAQLKLKMQTEGIDPNIIDFDPESPAPPGATSSQELVPAEVESSDSEDESDRPEGAP